MTDQYSIAGRGKSGSFASESGLLQRHGQSPGYADRGRVYGTYGNGGDSPPFYYL